MVPAVDFLFCSPSTVMTALRSACSVENTTGSERRSPSFFRRVRTALAIGVKSHSVSSVGEVLVDPDFFLKLLVSHSPSGIVLAHNHPKGNCAPSQEDDNATKQLMYLCKVHNILFCEHCIYGLDGVYSYSESKRLLEIAKMINKDW